MRAADISLMNVCVCICIKVLIDRFGPTKTCSTRCETFAAPGGTAGLSIFHPGIGEARSAPGDLDELPLGLSGAAARCYLG